MMIEMIMCIINLKRMIVISKYCEELKENMNDENFANDNAKKDGIPQ